MTISKKSYAFIGIVCCLLLGTLALESFSSKAVSSHDPAGGQPTSAGATKPTENDHLDDAGALEYCRKLLGNENVTGTELRLLYRQKKISKDRLVRCLMRRIGEFPDIESRIEIAQAISNDPAFRVWYQGMLTLALDAPSSSVEQKVNCLSDITDLEARKTYVSKLSKIMLADKSVASTIEWIPNLAGDERAVAFLQITASIALDPSIPLPESIDLDKLTEPEASELMASLSSVAGRFGAEIASNWLLTNEVAEGNSWAGAFSSIPSPSFKDADLVIERFPANANDKEQFIDGVSRKLAESNGLGNTISWAERTKTDISLKNQIIRSSCLQGGGTIQMEEVNALIAELKDKSSVTTLLESLIEAKLVSNSSKDLITVAELKKLIPK